MNDALGFVFVFAIVVATIGVGSTAGFSTLQGMRDAERVNNAERAFELLWTHIGDVTAGGAPSRTTAISLSDPAVSVGDPIRVTVSEADGGFVTTRTIDPIVYHLETGTRIVYAAGAIVRHQPAGGTVTHPPGFVLSAKRAVIPIVETRVVESGARTGDTTVLRTAVDRREVLYANQNGPVTLWVNLTTPRARAWHDHLGDRSDVGCEPISAGTVACRITTRRAYVTHVGLNTTLG